jgi:3-oxoadipate enol-lactonase
MTVSTVATVRTPLGAMSYAEHGAGPPMVLLHSLLTDRHAFDRVAESLPGRVIAVDLPGFGETSPAQPSIDDFAALISAGVDAVRGDDDPSTVIGNGLGAFVALGMGIADGSRLAGLILVGCGATFPEGAKPGLSGMVDAVESGGMAAVTPIALRRIFTEEYLADHPDEVEERSRVLANTNPEAFIAACRALQRVDFTEALSSIDLPTLIVVGEDDQATPPDMARALHTSLPDSKFVILQGVAHAPQIQEPSAFVDAIRDFLEGA